MKTAAIYIRVSTDEQIEGYSIDSQKDKLRAYCAARGYTLVGEYVDPGFSGSTTNRPALQRLIVDIKGIDCVIVYKLDRLSRSQKDTLYLVEDVFIANNVDFISVTESFDTTTPFGKAMVGMLSVFAQLERENIKDRMMSGKLGRAKAGKHALQGTLPIGYKRDGDDIIVNEYDAMQVKEVFRMYADGIGSLHIAKRMGEMGFAHTYGVWTSERVLRVVSNPVYIGKVTLSGNYYNGIHVPIVSEDLYDAAQSARYKKPTRSMNDERKRFLFSGFLFCADCGCRYQSMYNSNKKRGYACANQRQRKANVHRKQFDKFGPCKNSSVTEAALFNALDIGMKAWAETPSSDIVNNERTDVTVIKRKIESIDGQIERVMRMYELGTISFEQIGARSAELKEQKDRLTKTLVEMEEPKVDKVIAKSEALTWAILSDVEKRDFLCKYVHKLVLKHHGDSLSVQIIEA